MKHGIFLFAAAWLLLPSIGFATEPVDPSSSHPDAVDSGSASHDGKATADETDKAGTEKKSDDGNATFVDKDGDGINDGKENRFRNKSQRGKQRTHRQLMRKGRQSGKSNAGRNAR